MTANNSTSDTLKIPFVVHLSGIRFYGFQSENILLYFSMKYVVQYIFIVSLNYGYTYDI